MRVVRSSPFPPFLFNTCLRARPSFLVRPQIPHPARKSPPLGRGRFPIESAAIDLNVGVGR